MKKASVFKIEKNVPIPTSVSASGIKISDLPLTDMDVEDSFVIPIPFSSKAQNNFCSKINQFMKRKKLDYKFTVKKDSKTSNIRVWRIETSKVIVPVIESPPSKDKATSQRKRSTASK